MSLITELPPRDGKATLRPRPFRAARTATQTAQSAPADTHNEPSTAARHPGHSHTGHCHAGHSAAGGGAACPGETSGAVVPEEASDAVVPGDGDGSVVGVVRSKADRWAAEAGSRQERGARIVAALRAGPEPGDERALRQELVEVFMPMATSIAGRYRSRGESFEDLVQSACLGLVKAARGFDPAMGRDFEPYAVKTISGEVKRHFRDRTWQLRPPRHLQELRIDVARADEELTHKLGRSPRPSEVAQRLGVSIDEVAQCLASRAGYRMNSLDVLLDEMDASPRSLADTVPAVDDTVDLVDNLLSLQTALDQLPDRTRTILELRHWHELTQQEIGERVGITQMQVSRLLTRAHTELRRALLEDAEPAA